MSRKIRPALRGLSGLWILWALLLTACASTAPSPTPPPLLAPTASPAPDPSLTPTSLPAVVLTIRWPDEVSALEDIILQAELPGLAERDLSAQVRAQVVDPHHQVWWQSEMEPVGDAYTALTPLHLPLDPSQGNWRLTVFIHTKIPVNGGRTILFQPAPVPLRDLRGQVREGVTLHIPQAFVGVRAGGDLVAGHLAWAGADGEVGLWWAPGPAEPLTQDVAQILVEATDPAGRGERLEVAPLEWAGRAAFRFREQWPEGPGEVLVVQGADRWLYLLRIRALNRAAISPLLWDIQAGFRVDS